MQDSSHQGFQQIVFKFLCSWNIDSLSRRVSRGGGAGFLYSRNPATARLVGSRRSGNVHIAMLRIDANEDYILGYTSIVSLDIIPNFL